MVYRYELGGDIGPDEPLLVNAHAALIKLILWIMLNPSDATAAKDDQTVATIVRFSERWGYNRLMVGNLYAYRTKHPKIMWAAQRSGVDVVGPDNDFYIRRMVQQVRASGGRVMGAWGANAKPDRARAVHELAGDIYCLKLNDDGSPIHPLYQPLNTEPFLWQGMAVS
jgi:hypothetical protein